MDVAGCQLLAKAGAEGRRGGVLGLGQDSIKLVLIVLASKLVTGEANHIHVLHDEPLWVVCEVVLEPGEEGGGRRRNATWICSRTITSTNRVIVLEYVYNK